MKFSITHIRLILILIIVSIVGLATDSLFAANYTVLHFAIDRTQTPDLYYQDITLKIQVGDTSSIVAVSGGRRLPYRYESGSGELIVSTDGNAIDIYVAEAVITPGFGSYEITELYDDKKWAWSQGFDDNVFFRESIDLYKQLGYQATVFIIGDSVDMDRIEYWILDASSGYETNNGQPGRWVTGIKELVELEWGIGNHGWGSQSSCSTSDYTWEILRDNQLLMEIIAHSNNRSYKPLALAAPCFIAGYHPAMLDLRDNGVTRPPFQDIPYYIQFNESGNIEAPYIVDSENIFTSGDIVAQPFDFDASISRDYRIENDAGAVIEILNWMAANADDDKHFWYNTLAHGNNNDTVVTVLNYAHQQYGRAGSNEGWIAPSERIYSYMLNKDLVQVTFLGYEPSEPPEEPLYDYFNFLPLILRTYFG